MVSLVGAGPGDPGLLTVRGRDLLARADVVVYDALANPALLEIATQGGRDVELHDVGKRGGKGESAKQSDIDALLVRLGREGKRVVRLKGGDSFVFGRGSEEAQALAAAGIPFEVVPGVTAGIAAPAYAGIPVTHRAVATCVTFATGHETPEKGEPTTDWQALARAGGTIVLYMGVKQLSSIARALIEGGRPPHTPAAAVRWGTHPHQRTVVATLETLAERLDAEGMTPPVITIIGEVVTLREQIAWYERRPLFGRRIIVTRASAQASALTLRLAELGAEVIEAPTTRIEPVGEDALVAAVRRLREFEWLVFTSQNAVHRFWSALHGAGYDVRALGNAKVAAVGPMTADALRGHGVEVDVKPKRFVAEGLLEALGARDDVAERRVLYVAAEGARDVLPAGLDALGAIVERVNAYRSVPDTTRSAELRARLEGGDVDLVTFTSASGVRAFCDVVTLDVARRARAVTIGPETSRAVRECGLEVAFEAREATIDGLVRRIVEDAASS
jgi:uroporphyrinogen III methyltransferase / synthase